MRRSKPMELLPNEHKAKWFAGAALNTAEQSMASVMSTALSRLNAFLDTELEQLLCFDTEIDAETFCNRKSAIFVIMPEENPNTFFMLGGITELLNEVIADPESIQIPKSDHEESQEIKRLNAEISKALNTFGFDKEALKQKMLTCVSEKYTSLGTEEITAQSLKDIFKTVPPLTAYDSDLTDQAVSEIQLKGNSTISLVLINGQRIGKEKSA